jgi:hypothetical protein
MIFTLLADCSSVLGADRERCKPRGARDDVYMVASGYPVAVCGAVDIGTTTIAAG